MIDIVTIKGEHYSFDPDTLRVFKDSTLLPNSEVEPVYSDSPSGLPEFSGLFLKSTNQIISRTGKVSVLTDSNTIG